MTRRRFPLLRAAAELANAANGVQPLGREGYITLPVFAFGWPTSEAAPLYLAGSVLDAGRRGLRGDFRGAKGRIALALTAIAWALLGLIMYRNVTSKRYFEEPLREALGDDYEQVASSSQPARRSRLAGVGIPPNELVRRRYVERANTVQYGPHGRVNRADIWRRADLPRDGKAPVLLQVPGGAWAIGMRRPQAYPLLSYMAERGWVCVSIDYRVSPRNTWPAHIIDVKRALAWIKENIADYGGDPDFVAITGGSAGGHLSSLAALTPDDPQWQPGFEDADTSVAAAVPIYGRYDWVSARGSGRKEFIAFLQKFVVKKPITEHKQTYVDASSIMRVRPDAPPFFVLHGQDDSIIPVQEGREFVEALRKVSTSTVAYAEIPHAQHAFDFYGSPRAHYTAAAVERFLSWVHAQRQRSSGQLPQAKSAGA
ncbi:esterase [Mycolicibacterium novocastrense]|uniref:Alpha/beta hydrolase n=1 Tax=Mycolicibacterium novocastrense TaxID=59813 RepID=A0AAW5SG45_MYCNV|nr:alpha/beta hydrolase [Mycolicibacterium novocastrense]KUH66382.1 esterase [Mycolicibacterium novocastrense]KUH72736.1 esterase [Mycolicibacterium novocastrense]KUH74965.1 esterase [Mycolicibacterium novocastrense]MCV7022991.1 alpha/beta hydrolase [Mycolicibacterium novocastrense]GAT10917.1 esterase lipO [Mycolicibacterium novocastrense]